jgi:hypothetical protein
MSLRKVVVSGTKGVGEGMRGLRALGLVGSAAAVEGGSIGESLAVVAVASVLA